MCACQSSFWNDVFSADNKQKEQRICKRLYDVYRSLLNCSQVIALRDQCTCSVIITPVVAAKLRFSLK